MVAEKCAVIANNIFIGSINILGAIVLDNIINVPLNLIFKLARKEPLKPKFDFAKGLKEVLQNIAKTALLPGVFALYLLKPNYLNLQNLDIKSEPNSNLPQISNISHGPIIYDETELNQLYEKNLTKIAKINDAIKLPEADIEDLKLQRIRLIKQNIEIMKSIAKLRLKTSR